ncbi:hypothetical protein [Mesonia aestuariivivens]|uniref:Uncharacterized protein n=1 Tax=Mesonia aestuariivivens TaxID=2796128 RepID=A0ABS6VY77_9FLAO|nr:hypothetical protein [Mesonia aestuariivivens]MBW2960552.1 hypothetical protein [Mesonia aestuariivivens]
MKKKGAFFNSSNYEMNNLLCGIEKSEIQENEIYISEYPFEPSVAYPHKLINAKNINFISAYFGLCRIYVDHDILFVTAEQKTELLKFAENNGIKLKKHSRNWEWILEPYLDTEFTTEDEKRVERLLTEVGIDKIETEKIRKEVGKQMYKYNFDTMLWDWCSLGLCDVLSAMRVKYNKIEFRDFYKRAIEIDNRNTKDSAY